MMLHFSYLTYSRFINVAYCRKGHDDSGYCNELEGAPNKAVVTCFKIKNFMYWGHHLKMEHAYAWSFKGALNSSEFMRTRHGRHGAPTCTSYTSCFCFTE